MDSTSEKRPRVEADAFARWIPWAAFGLVFVVAVPIGVLRGAPTVVLWMAFASLAGAILLFWESLRLALDPKLPGDDAYLDEDEGLPAEIEARKRAALQALRDIQFERSIGRLSQEDYDALEAKYRAEASAAMKAMDEGLGPWMERAETLLREAESRGAKSDAKADAKSDAKSETKTEAKSETKSETKSEAKSETKTEAKVEGVNCAKCEQVNDVDAVFCKRCGARVKEEVVDA